jgi:hypothetical protein
MEPPEEERPYPIAVVNDLIEHYSTEHLRDAIKQCRIVIAQVVADDDRSDQQVARVKILRYLDLQLTRAVRWADDDADLMANTMRSLIELLSWADFVSQSTDNATRFLRETDIDSKELLQRFIKIVPAGTIPESINDLTAEITAKRVALQHSGNEDDFIWKLCSKLIHPTSLVLNHLEHTIKAVPFRQFLATRVVLYAWRVVYKFHDINFTN